MPHSSEIPTEEGIIEGPAESSSPKAEAPAYEKPGLTKHEELTQITFSSHGNEATPPRKAKTTKEKDPEAWLEELGGASQELRRQAKGLDEAGRKLTDNARKKYGIP